MNIFKVPEFDEAHALERSEIILPGSQIETIDLCLCDSPDNFTSVVMFQPII
jgi:hypothetical protein